MQRGTNMNWVAMARTVTLPSLATVVPRLCSANSPERCSVFGSMRSTLLGGLTLIVSAVNRIMLKVAAMKMPTPNAHSSSVLENPALMHLVRGVRHDQPTVPRGMKTRR